MSFKSLVVLASIGSLVWFFVFRPPSASSIARDTVVDVEVGAIQYDGVTYSGDWGDSEIYAGDIRYIGRAYEESVPIFTNDAILTTGDYSDPEIVKVTPIRNGNMSWRSNKKPQGSLVVLHFIPANMAVFDELQNVREGDRVEFTGRPELDSKVEGDDGSYVMLAHSNHKFILLEGLRR